MHSIKTEFYGTGTVGERGQIVIPAEARSALNVKSGDKFIFAGHGGILHLVKASEMDNIIERIHDRFQKAISKIKEISSK